MYLQALRFDERDELTVADNPAFATAHVTMMAWVRPVSYATADFGEQSRGIVMNKEVGHF